MSPPLTMSWVVTRPGRGLARLGLGLLWLACLAVWVPPLLEPRGEFGWGHYRIRDVYLGVPLALATLTATLVVLSPAPRRRPLGQRATAALTATLLALAGFDVSFSLLLSPVFWYGDRPVQRFQNTPDDALGWIRKPGLHRVGKDLNGRRPVVYRTDEHGFRNPPGLKRADLVFIGDSFTEGIMVPEEDSFVSRVSAATGLRAANLGRARYCPQQELLVLRKHGLSYRPRVVFWEAYEFKDLFYAEMFDAWKKSEGRKLAPPTMERIIGASRFNALLRGTERPSRLCRLRLNTGEVRPQRIQFAYRPDGPARYPLGFRETKRSIEAAYQLCRSRNIEFVVIMVPTAVRFLEPHLLFSDPALHGQLVQGGAVSHPQDFTAQLGQFCRHLPCPFLDLYPALRARAAVRNDDLIFPNDEHLATDGNAVVAKVIVEWLRARGIAAPK